jgi:predicted acetyltransferase
METFLLEAARLDQAPVLASLLQLYAHDLSEAFELAVGEDGRFPYPHLERYWREPDRRFPFLIRRGGELAGFVLATRGSPMSVDPSVLDVAEFFVLRRHRRSGAGRQAATILWDRLPGHWIVRVADCNRAALPFWRQVVGGYTGQTFAQEERTLSGRGWTRLSFDSRGWTPAAVIG